MEKVYLHAQLNISATGAIDSSRGLFQHRDAQYELQPLELTCTKPCTLSPAEAEPKKYILDHVGLLQNSLHDSPLAHRAWVFQERYLSPRILHFGAKQVFWECNEKILCERYPDNPPYKIIRNDEHKGFKSNEIQFYQMDKLPQETTDFINSEQGRLYLVDRWRTITKAYSKTDITFDSDRAVAISGVGRVLSEVFGQELAASMWRCEIQDQLLWHAEQEQPDDLRRKHRPSKCRGPTWSWLSVEGPITIPSCVWSRFHYEILDVFINHGSSPDPNVMVGGSLAVRGHLRRCALIRKQKVAWGELINTSAVNVGGNEVDVTVILDVGLAHATGLEHFDELFIMHAGTMNRHEVSGDAFHYMFVLRCVDSDGGTFERLGMAFCDVARQPHGPARWRILQEHNEDAATLPCFAYDIVRRLHTIMIH